MKLLLKLLAVVVAVYVGMTLIPPAHKYFQVRGITRQLAEAGASRKGSTDRYKFRQKLLLHTGIAVSTSDIAYIQKGPGTVEVQLDVRIPISLPFLDKSYDWKPKISVEAGPYS